MSVANFVFDGPQLASQLPLDTGDLGLQSAGMAAPIVHFDCHRDAVAILPHSLEALSHDAEHLVPFAFENRAHGVQAVIQAALFDDIERPSHVVANTFTLAQW